MKQIMKAAPWKIVVTALLCAALLLAVWLLNRPDSDAVPSSASLQVFVPARVTRVISDNASPDTWTEGLRVGTQTLELELLGGEYQGLILESPNFLSAYYNVDVKEGGRVIVRIDWDDDGEVFAAAIFNYDRGLLLGGFALAFAALLVVIGGKKGAKALMGLAFTLAALWLLLIPMIMRGVNSILAAIVIVALTTGVSLLLLNGWSLKTLCATLGCVGGVGVAGIAAGLTGWLGRLSGFNMQESEALVLQAGDSGMSIRSLLVCGILISSLGAVMDVAMAITSSLHELHTLNPKLGRGQLFRSGMNIGRDAMGTMANTLILAFVGSSLNVLLLFRIYDYPLIEILNSDMMALEILQGIAGSMGIILTVPLVAAIAAQIMTARKPEHGKKAGRA